MDQRFDRITKQIKVKQTKTKQSMQRKKKDTKTNENNSPPTIVCVSPHTPFLETTAANFHKKTDITCLQSKWPVRFNKYTVGIFSDRSIFYCKTLFNCSHLYHGPGINEASCRRQRDREKANCSAIVCGKYTTAGSQRSLPDSRITSDEMFCKYFIYDHPFPYPGPCRRFATRFHRFAAKFD